jgi:imidazolonepropionase-like amidohydrolase
MEEEIRAVVDECRRHGGKPVAAHAQGTAGILNAIRGGVTSIEHGYGLDERALDLAGERGTFVVPTLSTVFAGIDKELMPEHHYQKKVRWSGITKENIARAIEHGARIALGTDAAVCPHGQNLLELRFLVDLGMDPMTAIVAGTRVSAELLGLSDQLGTLTAGKTADLILCDGDPLADIGVLGDPGNIVCVVQDGVVRKDLLPAAGTR